MSIALRRPKMSLEEFLDWESRQELRWEFDGFEPVAMVGTTLRHNEIIGNVFLALRQRLGGRCRVYREGVRLRMAHTLRYPGVMVVCSRYPDTATWVTDPVVVFDSGEREHKQD
ncbi:MAG: Uma2 family endonuclease [Acetobacteraceae bacterium]|nr:Uma2 family endonuclease [Acetobacteraceae bacterium]